MIKTKISTIAIITILTLSIMLAAIPMAHAIGTVTVEPNTGPVGKFPPPVVTVPGTTPGGLVRIYWNSIKDWDGTAGFLAEAYAVGTEAKISITIPEAVQGDYYVIAQDVVSGLTAFDSFTVTSEIKLTPKTAISGDTIAVSGTGFAASTPAVVLYGTTINTSVLITGTWTITGGTGALTDTPIKPDDGNTITVAGNLSSTPVTVTFTDELNGTLSSVTAGCSGTINYVTGAVALTIAADTLDTLDDPPVIASYTYYDTTTKVGIYTDSFGSFSASLTAGVATVTIGALDSKGNEATATLTIVTSVISLSPKKGYIDTTVTITGRGFTPSKLVDIRWYLTGTDYVTLLNDAPIDATGAFTVTITVPLLPDPTAPGKTYTVKAIDNAPTPIDAVADFLLTEVASIKLTPAAGKVASSVTVTGTWFSASKAVTVTFDGTQVATGATGGTGAFSVIFTVPNVALGPHTVTATDAMGVSVSATFTVIVDVFTAQTRATGYLRMDIISIVSQATAKAEVNLVITDPTGLEVYKENVANSANDWQMIVPFYQINPTVLTPIQIASDAPLGTWNFTCYDTANKILDTNLFTVSALPTMQTALDQLDALDAKITSIDGAVATVSTKVGTIQTTVSGLDAKITSINNGMATAQTSLGTVQTSLESLDAVLGVVAGDTATIKTSIGTFETSLDALDATITVIGDDVTAMAGDIVTIKTSIGTLNGTITSIEDGIATIDTEVGTIQADVTALQTDVAAIDVSVDMTPIWIAVVLSMVAAIAACYAVITIRQKIAG